MKKLVLKKEVVARINNDQMNQMRGGFHPYIDTFGICQTMPGAHATCTAARTCEPNVGCEDATQYSCGDPQALTGCNTISVGCITQEGCGGSNALTCDICGLSHMASQCDTCYIKCTNITY